MDAFAHTTETGFVDSCMFVMKIIFNPCLQGCLTVNQAIAGAIYALDLYSSAMHDSV
jgi:hypothetical protein